MKTQITNSYVVDTLSFWDKKDLLNYYILDLNEDITLMSKDIPSLFELEIIDSMKEAVNIISTRIEYLNEQDKQMTFNFKEIK